MKVLFICNFGKHRSRTAAELFKDKFETQHAGIYANLVTEDQVKWADLIVTMEDYQKQEIQRRFSNCKKQIVSLGISDTYSYNDPALRSLLKCKESLIKLE